MAFGGPVGWSYFARRHRIKAAGMQGMAARQSPHRQPAALECAEARDRFHRIHRARRVEAARGTDQWTDPALVATQHQDEQAIYHDSFMPTGSYWRLFTRGMCAPVSPCIQVRGNYGKTAIGMRLPR